MQRLTLVLLLAAGCSDYELGAKKDALPGGDSADTAVLGACPDEAPAGPAGVAIDQDCLVEPTQGEFTPMVEWQWNDHPAYPGYHQLMATPAVANLTDDNDDGAIDEDDIPEVIFTSFTGSAYTSAGVLTAIHGDSGAHLWSVSAPGGYPVYSSAGVAVGDLDGDGSPEVCTAGTTASVVCLEADGTFKWAAGSVPYYVGCPAIADLDGDGLAEVLFGNLIFGHDGTLLGTGEYGVAGRYMSFGVDMDNDGQLEVVAGNAVYELDGSLLWTDGLTDGIPAVGDFDDDGLPEVVRTAASTLILTDTDGTVLWQVAVPGGGGGAPTVADYDGDGQPEVGVAGLSFYTLFDTDGSVLWSNPTEDDSSSVTGSSVFDFDRDGAAEVVYADEHALYIYDGATGTIRMMMDGHASATLFEYPIVADVDNDGSTEIVLASNNYAWAGWNGITVIGDAANTWAPARPIWNQFAYHITNVEGDGGIPTKQQPNWRTWNSFRAGGTEQGPADWLADLVADEPEVCLDECDMGEVVLWVPVANQGLLASGTAQAELRRASGEVLETSELPVLQAGKAAWAGPFRVSRGDWGGDPLFIELDLDDAVEECDEANTFDLGGWPCP